MLGRGRRQRPGSLRSATLAGRCFRLGEQYLDFALKVRAASVRGEAGGAAEAVLQVCFLSPAAPPKKHGKNREAPFRDPNKRGGQVAALSQRITAKVLDEAPDADRTNQAVLFAILAHNAPWRKSFACGSARACGPRSWTCGRAQALYGKAAFLLRVKGCASSTGFASWTFAPATWRPAPQSDVWKTGALRRFLLLFCAAKKVPPPRLLPRRTPAACRESVPPDKKPCGPSPLLKSQVWGQNALIDRALCGRPDFFFGPCPNGPLPARKTSQLRFSERRRERGEQELEKGERAFRI